MEDLRALLTIAARHTGKLLVLALLSAALLAYPRAHVKYVSISPDRSYRLEHYQPGLLQGLYYYYIVDMEAPAFVRLYRNMDNHYFGESPVLDFFGGVGTLWAMEQSGEVALWGYTFRNVPPVGPGDVILKIPKTAPASSTQD